MSSGDGYELVKCLPGLPRTVRGRPINIKTDPKGKNYLYCNGNSVFIRDVNDASECDVYSQHAKETTVAAYAPSGFYICSGDITGKVRIWDTVNKEHILKYEYQSMSGSIKDIAWTEDSKRIAVCGEGREKFASAFLWDSGSSVGDLTGPGKSCNNVDIKQSRPYRLILASEDFSTCFYEGPPFKFKEQKYEHSNFVNCCRFSPDGSKYVTAGSDGRCFVYDGKTCEMIGEINEPSGKIHKAGVYGVAWSPDGKKLMTCSADKTVKIWNMDEKHFISNKEETVFTLGNTIDDMQVGCAWMGNTLISVSLSGFINILDPENPSLPKQIIKGHNKAIVSSCMTEDRSVFFTASFDGKICHWDTKTGLADNVTGKGHTNQVTKMCCQGDTLITCSMDDTVRFISISEKKYKDDVVKLPSQPQAVACGNLGFVVVACLNEVVVIQDGKITHNYKTETDIANTAVAVNSTLGKVCVGTQESKVHVYDISGDELKMCGSFACNGNVTDIKFSPNNAFVGLCTGKKQVKIMETSDFKTQKCNWGSHAVKVNAVSWSPDSTRIASAGTDGHVFVWDIAKNDYTSSIRGAHSQSVDVTSIQWSDDNTLVTTGRQDCSIRMWKIKE